jgi:hypothetical protein
VLLIRSNFSFSALGVSTVSSILSMSGRFDRDYEMTAFPLLSLCSHLPAIIAYHSEIASLDFNSVIDCTRVGKK